jgi:hypothetical protein
LTEQPVQQLQPTVNATVAAARSRKQRVERPDNHWFDCLVGCAVAASMLGAKLASAHCRLRHGYCPVVNQLGEELWLRSHLIVAILGG